MHSVGLKGAPLAQSRADANIALPRHSQAIGLTLVLVAATAALYLPVVHHPFANIDDQGYVYENLHVQGGITSETVRWAFGTFDDSNWHPLTWLSHSLDCQMFGLDPAGHHEMNAVLHAVNAGLLFWILFQATGFIGRSFTVAALFALHPINVESVAWVAERKTVLSTLFFLLALWAYQRYARQPGVGRYMVVAALFALGLMAKPQIITLPFVLLLWDYWPLRRMFAESRSSGKSGASAAFQPRSFWWLVKEKIPLFVMCAASALVTMKAQHVGHPQYWAYSAWVRIGNSIVAYVRYMGKALWPSHLAIMYLHPGTSLRIWQVVASGLLLSAITLLVIVGQRHRYFPVGWFWFLGTLVPTIGLIQVGRQALADRYAYQSFVGLFILICWGVGDWAKQRQLPKAFLPAASIAMLVALAVATHRQLGYWSDNLTLWSHDLQVTENNWMAEDMVANILAAQGHREEAISLYTAAAAVNPDDSVSNLAVAIYEQQHGQANNALQHYKKALSGMDDPLERAKVYNNMALAYRDLGDTTQYQECLRKMAKLRRH